MPVAGGLYYFSHGSEEILRPPVVLIHGAGGTHLNWPPQIRRLMGQRIFAVDLPGHGKSDGLLRQSIGEYAADILEFLNVLKLSTAALVGHSMGSAVALTVALTAPDRVLGLGLLGGGPRLRVSPAIMNAFCAEDTFLSGVKMVNDACYSSKAEPGLRALGEKQMAETRPLVFQGDLLACDTFNMQDELPRIQAPTLVLVGAEDKLTPIRLSETLSSQIPNARLSILPETGHMLMLERPYQTADLLVEFLSHIPYQPGR